MFNINVHIVFFNINVRTMSILMCNVCLMTLIADLKGEATKLDTCLSVRLYVHISIYLSIFWATYVYTPDCPDLSARLLAP